jgi:hypothetical protein
MVLLKVSWCGIIVRAPPQQLPNQSMANVLTRSGPGGTQRTATVGTPCASSSREIGEFFVLVG